MNILFEIAIFITAYTLIKKIILAVGFKISKEFDKTKIYKFFVVPLLTGNTIERHCSYNCYGNKKCRNWTCSKYQKNREEVNK